MYVSRVAEIPGGVVLIINGPRVWPNSGTMIPSGSQISLSLECVSGYATQRVLELDRDRQPCLYDETGMYNQETCLSHCKRNYVIKYCGCNPSFLFPTAARYRDCTIEDFICLFDYNGLETQVNFGGEVVKIAKQ
ncbi:sodium channel protein nach [Lasius niger]|uniref:Sodium channel protein nach n=1 Tax=Lasius niger TaxID=67767 RepID=A0A0J7KN67_LASNI|nr:sodium channel protein nach [Lasius niger]